MTNLAKILPNKVIAIEGSTEIDIKGIAFNSRNIKKGYLFVALPGNHVKGSSFIFDAIERGAAAVLTEAKVQNLEVPYIRVSNARAALSEISCKFYGDPSNNIKLIGITGTKGKTTTTYLVQSILSKAFNKAFRIGTVEYDMVSEKIKATNTTPESLVISELIHRATSENITSGVIEVSSHALKTWRVADLTFSAAGFTNLSVEHTEFHPDMEDYYETKKRFFTKIKASDKPAIISIDDEYGKRMASECSSAGCNVTTISVDDKSADVFAQNIKLNGMNSTFQICDGNDIIDCKINLAGIFNVFNAVMAAVLCKSVGIKWPDIIEGIEAVKYVPGRFEVINNNKGLNVIVDYAHSPAALENVLQAVKSITKNKIITVFGCGGDRSREKRPIMGKIAVDNSQVVIVTSDNPRKEDPEEIIEQILAGIPDDTEIEVHREVLRDTAIQMALNLAEPGDSVLIAGKGHETGQKFANKITPFDDRDIVRKFFLRDGENA